MLNIHFTSEDLIRTRVAAGPDPLWEIVLSLHVLQSRRRASAFDRWSRDVRARIAELGGPGPLPWLIPLVPIATYLPDFLTPAEAAGGLDVGIDAVLSTPPARLRTEIGWLGATRRLPAWAEDLAAGRTRPLVTLGRALRDYHRFALAPYGDKIQERVDIDRRARGQALLDGGPEHLLETLSPQMSWHRPVLEVVYPVERDVHLDGRGLTLTPSFFCQTGPITLADTTLPPVLAYPIARTGFASGAVPAGLSMLLGATRAAVLAAARPGRSTGELAKLLRVSAGTVSYHVSALRDAELVTSRRDANVVVHTTTPLGDRLLRGGGH